MFNKGADIITNSYANGYANTSAANTITNAATDDPVADASRVIYAGDVPDFPHWRS